MTKTAPAALHHTCFLVRDVEGTARRLSDTFGIGPWNVWTITPAHCMVHGKESPFSFRVALTTVGGGTFELISPHSGRSVFDEHLERHGEGFHHICMVYDSMAAVRAAKDGLRAEGREMIQEGSAGDVFDFAYFRFPEIDSVVELLYLDGSKLPPPEAMVQAS